MNKPIFVTFEGGEGAGKTTQVEMLSKWMTKFNLPFLVTKEPGSPHLNECVKIRELLLNPINDLTPSAELMLFLADRSQHVQKLICPALASGKHVICDRYSDSTRIYQCARGLGKDKVDILLDFATGGLQPDITFLLDIPVEIGLERARAKSIYKEGDRMEQAGHKFHESVRYGFLKLAESIAEEHRFRIIEVGPPKTVDQVHQEILRHVSQKLWAEIAEEDLDT
jgi:dTMP kinase